MLGMLFWMLVCHPGDQLFVHSYCHLSWWSSPLWVFFTINMKDREGKQLSQLKWGPRLLQLTGITEITIISLLLLYDGRERLSLEYINRTWITLLQEHDIHGFYLSYVMKKCSCLWSPYKVWASFLSAKEELISSRICKVYPPNKIILEVAKYFSISSSDVTNPKTKPTSLTGSRTRNLDFREFETWTFKTLGNSQFWASSFSVFRYGDFTAAARNCHSCYLWAWFPLS